MSLASFALGDWRTELWALDRVDAKSRRRKERLPEERPVGSSRLCVPSDPHSRPAWVGPLSLRGQFEQNERSSAASRTRSCQQRMSTGPAPEDLPVDPGQLPPWGQIELPAPPPFTLRNALKLIGPGAIALGVSIGSGEGLLGPAVTAKYGAALLWVASASILLQMILNQEMIRYTVATGEPIFT